MTITLIERYEANTPEEAGIAAIENINETYRSVTPEHLESIVVVANTYDQLDDQENRTAGLRTSFYQPNGCVCVLCKQFSRTNQGETEMFMDGTTIFTCPHCGDNSLLIPKDNIPDGSE